MIHKKKKKTTSYGATTPGTRAEAGAKNFGVLLQKHGSFGSTPDEWRPRAIQRDPNLWINRAA